MVETRQTGIFYWLSFFMVANKSRAGKLTLRSLISLLNQWVSRHSSWSCRCCNKLLVFIPRLETRFLNWPHLLSCHVLSVFSSYFLPLFKTEIYLHFTPYLFSFQPASWMPSFASPRNHDLIYFSCYCIYRNIWYTHTLIYLQPYTNMCILCVCENACMIYSVLLILDKQLKISPLKRTISPALSIPPLPGLLCLWVEPIRVSCFHVTVANDVLLLQIFPEKFPFWCY